MGLVAEHFYSQGLSVSPSQNHGVCTHKLLGSAHQAGVASAQGLAIYWGKGEWPGHIKCKTSGVK